MTHIDRKLDAVTRDMLKDFKVIAIIEPRQVGKSTLAAKILGKGDIWLDLERPSDLRKLDDPGTFLSLHTSKLVCIDEVQSRPDLFPVLRALTDARPEMGQYLILGSSSPDLQKQHSQTLAGRIQYLGLTPFLLEELSPARQLELWLKGGYPLSFLSGEPR